MSNKKYPTSDWAKWAESISILKTDFVSLMTKREIWRALKNAYEKNSNYQIKQEAHQIIDWINRNYVDSMLIGLRRIIDTSKDTVSLIKLLEEISKNPTVITFDRYQTLWTSGSEQVNRMRATEVFKRFSKDNRNLDVNIIKNDIRELKESNERFINIVNHHIAHKGKDADNPPLTYEELHAAFDKIAGILNEYHALLTTVRVLNFAALLPVPIENIENMFSKMIFTDINTNDEYA
ncbi:MAG: hypothetical protein COV34_02960 [Candidatus Zambryskibacteria bacterium CG10_big_fil_rev_8_21_14_0_10_42_12]|uniref:HEPN AbiU2-like domain-containing protein n=1 Tax=Candidatus Zambryskibacteria bacterium CG10_big_fil_rev_8_21_14_0_10_42_12 TaxID=1975115 RepID=A0A2H0QVF7_9BACT|nr:MAG: hypothetical protein COV34_02960 [Candidatus Zambryskibacteria bacterium CG10_big_fil_rev_8_21_14_0_10_42_12]